MARGKFLRKLLPLVLAGLMSFSFFACGEENTTSNNSSETEETKIFADSAQLTVSEFSDPVSLVHPVVSDYLQADPSVTVADFASRVSGRPDKGMPVTIEYSFTNPKDAEITEKKLEISSFADFSTIEQTLHFPSRRNSVEIARLQPSAVYYYRVTVTLDNGEFHVKTREFNTAASPRLISLDGANNVRDIGGWKTESGKTIKYGLLFRGSEIDGMKYPGNYDFCLTEKGIEQLRSLGIKTDFDLRVKSDGKEESALGADVTHTFYNFAHYQDVFKEANKEKVRSLFSDLANPEAYPAYIHCTHGVDRAGTASMLLESLLGVGEADLIRDYELSAFYYTHVTRSYNNGGTALGLIDALKGYEGENLADKTANFLLSVGVTQTEIDAIRSIFLG